MFIYTVRATTVRFALVLVLTVSVFLLVLFFGGGESVYAMADGEVIRYSGVRTAEERVDFLKQFGIEVKEGSEHSESFSVAQSLDRVLLSYNELQKKQGLDLSKYSKKKITRYAYKVTNYDAKGDVYANLFIHRGKIIACDLSSVSPDGFVVPLTLVDKAKLK